MGKKTVTLPIHCEQGDVDLLDSVCSQFDLFPPKRSELARTLLRFAMNSVSENPGLLKEICRIYQNETIAEIDGMVRHFLLPKFREEVERAQAVRRRGFSDAFGYVFETGAGFAGQCGYLDGEEDIAVDERKAG